MSLFSYHFNRQSNKNITCLEEVLLAHGHDHGHEHGAAVDDNLLSGSSTSNVIATSLAHTHLDGEVGSSRDCDSSMSKVSYMATQPAGQATSTSILTSSCRKVDSCSHVT